VTSNHITAAWTEKKRKEKKRKEKKRKEKKRKDYTFRHQFNEKPSIIPGCPEAAWTAALGAESNRPIVVSTNHNNTMHGQHGLTTSDSKTATSTSNIYRQHL